MQRNNNMWQILFLFLYFDRFLVWLFNFVERNKLLKDVPENIFCCDFETVQTHQCV